MKNSTMVRPDEPVVSEIFKTALNEYRHVKQIYTETGYEQTYPLNFFWGGDNLKQLMKIISSPLSATEKIAAIHKTDMFSVNTDDEQIKNLMVDWYIEYFQSIGVTLNDLDYRIQESPISNPGNAVLRDGRLLAPDFLRTVVLCLEVKKHCRLPSGKFNVLELGAGYGGLARSLKLFFPTISYVIIDIPETLFFSSLFLRLNFPQAKVCFVTNFKDLRHPLEEYDFVFVPTKFADVLLGNRFDLFCNTASLGEMKNTVIRYWMDFIQNKVEPHYFFGLNRFLNTIDPDKHGWRLEENECSALFDSRWKILKWELEPPFSRCPYFEAQVTRNLEIIAERSPQTFRDPAAERNASRSVVRDLAKQDWFLHAGDSENTMRLRDFSLAPDLAMDGTLFKLWESIRLEPRVDNVSMILIFLVTLMRRDPFEEIFYYLNLLEKLERNEKSAKPPEKPDPPLVSLTLRQAEIINLIRESGASLHEQGGAGSTKRKKFSPYMYHVLAYWGRPELIEEGYKGYNIILHLDKYYGMAQSLGSLDLTQMEEQILEKYKTDGTCVVGKELDETKRLIDTLDFKSSPELVEEGYRGFNVVRYKRDVYAISLSLGPVDLPEIEASVLKRYQEGRQVLIASTIAEVKEAIDQTFHRVFSILPKQRPADTSETCSLSLKLGNPDIAQRALRRIQAITPSAAAVSALQKGAGTQDLEISTESSSAEETVPGKGIARKEKALFICNIPPWRAESYFNRLQDFDLTLLPLNGKGEQGVSFPQINLTNVFSVSPDLFREHHFDLVVIPYEKVLFWGNHNLAAFSASFVSKVLLLFSNGKCRFYEGENLHRLQYNTAYLHSMFRFVANLRGKRILEVGCSDGLVCDLLTNEDPEEVIGIDILDSVGCNFRDPKITYKKMNGSQLLFEDHSFDLCYSIATLEHCSDPLAVLQEMKRVIKKGGYGYVQAGPLYYSPYGHHMFGYFDDFPWIHLRLSKDEIADYGKSRGIDKKLREDRDIGLRQYVDAMLNREHINEKSFGEYGLAEFMKQPEIEVLNFSRSYEGEDLLNPELLTKLSDIWVEDLISHGFEVIFRVR